MGERRYPPAPYPAHSDELRRYRDAWDLGWKHYAALRAQVLAHEAGLSGPTKHGYRDGVIARWTYEQRERKHELEAKRRDLKSAVRAEPDEPPY